MSQYLFKDSNKDSGIHRIFSYSNLVNTGRKLNVRKTFRRRLGHFLNVLCTFNLRPVSTGELTIEALEKGLKYFLYCFIVFGKSFTRMTRTFRLNLSVRQLLCWLGMCLCLSVLLSIMTSPKYLHPNYHQSIATSRRSHQRCSMKKSVLRTFAKFIGKHLKNIFFTEPLRTAASGLLSHYLVVNTDSGEVFSEWWSHWEITTFLEKNQLMI